ncbi:Kinesin-like protein [Plasmodiophora brassicae]|uniref:Kinesin-like protein n=1 Tax=Plasmodiophora brassicae TaxID=37360 RepID=A0A0G4IYI2_PLABS|nr:hypothetical protein PBRA_001449 [Plasmodiophora brassicae]
MGKPSTTVRVVCRFRPRNKLEIEMNSPVAVEVIDNNVASIMAGAFGGKSHRFDFDYVFGDKSRQEDVFEATAGPMVVEALQGYNSTVFAYGQTGAGKSFTMMGTPGNKGIIPRMVQKLFDGITAAPSKIEFTIKVSYLEIYLEKVRDLLDVSRENLRIREGPNGMWVEGATEVYVANAEEVRQVMELGSSNRAIASTRMNMESSRSHSVFMINIHQLDTITKSKKDSKLLLVDLAGSEKVEKTEASGMALKEAQNINKSLSALGNVINALTTNNAHVPYRDSKLTKLLSDSLGGNSLCCLIICCSPSAYNVVETVTTCRFGQRAKLIQNKAKINSEKSLAEYKMLLEEAQKKIEQQEGIIRTLEAELGIPESQRTLHVIATSSAGDSESLSTGHLQRHMSTTQGTSSTIVDLQEKLDAISTQLREAREDNEALRDKMADLQSDLAIKALATEDLEKKLYSAVHESQASEDLKKACADDVSEIRSHMEKLAMEVEAQRLRAEQAELEVERLDTEQRTRLETLGSWTKTFHPKPAIDESLPAAKQLDSVSRQYVGLFHELINKSEQLVQMQESYSDLEEELKAHRAFQEKGYLDDESTKLLAKRAFAETQAAKLREENDRLKRVEQCQMKLLESWKSHMVQMEGAVEVIVGLGKRRQEDSNAIIRSLKREADAYRRLIQRRATATFVAPMLHVHKPIHGGGGGATQEIVDKDSPSDSDDDVDDDAVKLQV